ncbi:acyl-CoA thioesterase [Pontixanthobacter gangjinensis]|uniref:Acyl-CoA thioesterase n=1 Tax=Christiangramia aestuarii TaxID=1028746 RepID=A0A7K1LQ36_9FLAO|nr:thioesterase family protein [Christiangramia aestuarii]MUP42868.1 acyl-CoA thioesterase [Christiangramia aestuarii]
MSNARLTSTIKLKVRFHECDPLQIVWHGNYYKYFEEGREAFGREHGISYLDVKKHGFATPIVKSHCEHKLPLKYGDEFEVVTNFVNSAAAKLVFQYQIFCSGRLICAGETTQVFTDKNSELVLNNPPFFLDWKTKMGLIQ